MIIRRSDAPWYIRPILWFARGFTITIGRSIYVSDTFDSWPAREREAILAHERVHLEQWRRWKILFPVLYLLLPVPIFFAYFRWRFEREAFLVNVRQHGYDVEQVVDSLWSGYFWTWPRAWMLRWFYRKVGHE